MRVVSVSQCLDKKLKLLGFEVADLFAIFFVLSILNFIFGSSVLFVWLPTAALALILRYGKRGKPDKYLLHFLRYQVRPATLSAFQEPSITIPPPRLRGKSL